MRKVATDNPMSMIQAMRAANILLLMTLMGMPRALAESANSKGPDDVEFVSRLQSAGGVELPQGAFRAATFSVG